MACLLLSGGIALNGPVANSKRDLDEPFSALDPRTPMHRPTFNPFPIHMQNRVTSQWGCAAPHEHQTKRSLVLDPNYDVLNHPKPAPEPMRELV